MQPVPEYEAIPESNLPKGLKWVSDPRHGGSAHEVYYAGSSGGGEGSPWRRIENLATRTVEYGRLRKPQSRTGGTMTFSKSQLQELVYRQQEVVVTGPTGITWAGTIIGLSEEPAMCLRVHGGDKVMLPQRFLTGDPAPVAKRQLPNFFTFEEALEFLVALEAYEPGKSLAYAINDEHGMGGTENEEGMFVISYDPGVAGGKYFHISFEAEDKSLYTPDDEEDPK